MQLQGIGRRAEEPVVIGVPVAIRRDERQIAGSIERLESEVGEPAVIRADVARRHDIDIPAQQYETGAVLVTE